MFCRCFCLFNPDIKLTVLIRTSSVAKRTKLERNDLLLGLLKLASLTTAVGFKLSITTLNKMKKKKYPDFLKL